MINLTISLFALVPSNPWRRISPAGSEGIGCGIWNRCWPALSCLTPDDMSWDQFQEPIFRPVPALPHEWAVWDCCHFGRHCGNYRSVSYRDYRKTANMIFLKNQHFCFLLYYLLKLSLKNTLTVFFQVYVLLKMRLKNKIMLLDFGWRCFYRIMYV